MSTAGLYLPPEIWCQICQCIPPSDRPSVALVNRCLYGIIISDLYYHVEIVSRNPSLFLHAFQTLDREQDLAKRLHKLTIWVHALNEVIYLEDSPNGPTPDPPNQTKGRSLPPNRNRTRSFRQLINGGPNSSPSSPILDKKALFMGVLSKLPQLRDLVFVWHTDTGYNRASPTTCSQLVIDAWASVGRNIRSLTLDMAMFNLFETLRTPQDLAALEELHIRIALEKHGAFRGNAARILTNTLIPFINNLASQLTLFAFTSLCNLNLDPLFQGMDPTPQLRHLILCLGFQPHEMWSASALQTFLRNRSSIQQLDLRYGECCTSQFRQNLTFHDPVLVGEAFTGTNTVTLPQLESVTLGLWFKLSENFLLGRYVTRFSGPSVSSLTLLGRSLSFTQIKLVLVPFQKSLKTLKVFVEALTTELLSLIATLLPLLRDLTLHVQSYSKSGPSDYGKKNTESRKEFLQMLSALRKDKIKILNQWQLSHICVREFAYGKGDIPAWDVMQAIRVVVPSIHSWDV